MKVKIRKGFFETNSSSIHAIVLPKGLLNRYEIPTVVKIHLLDDISEIYPIRELEDKLNFMITILYAAKSGYEIKYLVDILSNCRIKVNITDDRVNKAMYDEIYEDLEIFDIENLVILIRKVLYNEEILLRYLFSDTIVDYRIDHEIFETYYQDIYDILI